MQKIFAAPFALVLLLAAAPAYAQTGGADVANALAKRDYATAIKILTPLAEKGDDQACAYLASIEAGGFCYPTPHTDAAVKWLTCAAKGGLKEAQATLGDHYSDGVWVKQDYAEAAKWYRLAADQGFAPSQVTLGQMYQLGRGVNEDQKEALKLYLAAAGQGLALAQTDVGIMYANGLGTTRDIPAAIKYFRMAADQYDVQAAMWLGSAYETGAGVQKELTIAYMWNLIGQKNADTMKKGPMPVMPLPTGFAVILDNLGHKMSAAEIQLAHQMAERWKPGSAERP